MNGGSPRGTILSKSKTTLQQGILWDMVHYDMYIMKDHFILILHPPGDLLWYFDASSRVFIQGKMSRPWLHYWLLYFQSGLTSEFTHLLLWEVFHWSWTSLQPRAFILGKMFISDLGLQLDEFPGHINWRFLGFCYPMNISGTVFVPALGQFLCLLVLLLGFPASLGWLSVLGSLLSWPAQRYGYYL